MVTVNVPGASVQNVAQLNSVLNPTDVAAFLQAVEANAQAQQNANALTLRLRNEGRIGPNQRVVAFQDGRVFVVGGP
jgi:hypothetical protein